MESGAPRLAGRIGVVKFPGTCGRAGMHSYL